MPAAADLSARIRTVPAGIAAELRRQELAAFDGDASSDPLIGRASNLITPFTDLCSIVFTVVGRIHIVSAKPGYDVSHSEPRWRSSIFVSIPERSDEVGALRLAESIIHEAMHLHLTNLEAEVRLVANVHEVMVSPWRAEPRPYQGVFHGLFVFTCLAWYFRHMAAELALGPPADAHAVRRSNEIAMQIACMDLEDLCSGLTRQGADLARCWAGSVLGTIGTLEDVHAHCR